MRLMRFGVLVLITGALASACSSSSSAGVTAASGCIDAWSAISSAQSGTMDTATAIRKLQSAASEVRSVADENPKYAPIAQWIVGAEGEIAAGHLGPNAGDLYAECGPGRRK